jgi:hypothetical protein
MIASPLPPREILHAFLSICDFHWWGRNGPYTQQTLNNYKLQETLARDIALLYDDAVVWWIIRQSAQFIQNWLAFSDEVLFFSSCLAGYLATLSNRNYIVGYDEWWTGTDSAGSDGGLVEIPSHNLPGGKHLSQDDRCSNEIRPEHLPNTSAQRYRIPACSARCRLGSASTLQTDMALLLWRLWDEMVTASSFVHQQLLTCTDCVGSNGKISANG